MPTTSPAECWWRYDFLTFVSIHSFSTLLIYIYIYIGSMVSAASSLPTPRATRDFNSNSRRLSSNEVFHWWLERNRAASWIIFWHLCIVWDWCTRLESDWLRPGVSRWGWRRLSPSWSDCHPCGDVFWMPGWWSDCPTDPWAFCCSFCKRGGLEKLRQSTRVFPHQPTLPRRVLLRPPLLLLLRIHHHHHHRLARKSKDENHNKAYSRDIISYHTISRMYIVASLLVVVGNLFTTYRHATLLLWASWR